MKQITTLFLIAILMVTATCSYGQCSIKQDFKTTVPLTNNNKLTIETFSNFPDEIDGCSCYFSNNSKEFQQKVYIYVNDYAQTSFLKINGKLTKFIQTEYKNIDDETVEAKGKSRDFELSIQVVHGVQSGDETTLQSGTIIVTDKKGNKLTRTFYGECGC